MKTIDKALKIYNDVKVFIFNNTELMKDIILNLLLHVRFNIFKKYCKRIDFSNHTLVFSDDFKSLDNFNIKDGEFYNDNDVWFSKDTVTLTNEGVNISCIESPSDHTSWQGERITKWTSGMIDTRNKVSIKNGIWVITAKICNSWPAIWLLKYDRMVPNHTKERIIPEVDIMEVIDGVVRHTIHYGYPDDDQYSKLALGNNICKCDNQFHEFATELLENGYKFYIDGILTASFTSKDPEFVSNDANYLILNNAANPSDTGNTNFIIRSIKVYEK